MYRTSETGTERSLVVEKVLEDIVGGGIVDPDDFKTTSTKMDEGALLGIDTNGVYHLTKTAEIHENEAADETGYKVKKGHEFKVGDFIVDSALTGAAYAISAIDTTNEDYDVLTVGTTLGHAMTAGECLVQANAEATAGNAVYKYSPKGIALNSVDLSKDNLGCGILRRGTVREALLPYPVDTSVKALLQSETAHILFI